MCAWRTSRENGRLFEMLAELPCAVQIEDPFPYENRDDWRKVRESRIATLICHARGENVLEAALRDEIADAFNLGGGSAYEFLKLATVADFHGKDCWHGSGMELGVLQALHLHAASCARNCLLASDLQSEWTREHTLVHPRMSYRGNSALLSDAPGLGVELDLKSLERYCVKHHTITL